jgi:uncharacterized protein YhbP (UPF0306 family)
MSVPLSRLASPLPASVCEFLRAWHVLSLGVTDAQGPWAASLFYAFDESAADLIVLTSTKTRHGQCMVESPVVAGTVVGQAERITDIRGVQFTAQAKLLKDTPRSEALDIFLQRHPIARLKPSEVWALRLIDLKYTDNQLVFARKTRWQRDLACLDAGDL